MLDTFYLKIKEAADVLVEAEKSVLGILSGQEHSSLSLAVGPQLQQIINRLYFMSGTPPTAEQMGKVEEFPPVTNFMGDPISLPKKVSQEDLSPADFERENFIQKVEKLES